MLTQHKMQTLITSILLFGTLLSVLIVMISGSLYLYQSGNDSLQSELFQPSVTHTTKQIWEFAISFSPLGIVQLGLLLLVMTQTVRVGLLCWFYSMIRDYKFAVISLFILFVLIYSSFWRS